MKSGPLESSSAQGVPFGWLAFVAGLFTLYGSLLPLEFAARAPSSLAGGYLGLARGSALRLSLPDLATNFALFVPLAFFLAGYLERRASGLGALMGCALLVAGCGLFSAAIEFAQLYFPPRTSSIYDLAGNVAGASAGALAWNLAGGWLRSAALRWRLDTERWPVPNARTRLAIAILALPYAAGLMLAAGWFSTRWRDMQGVLDGLGQVRLLPFVRYFDADIWQSGTSVALQCAIYAPLGYALWRRGARRPVPRHPLILAAALAAAVALFLEAGKLLVPGKHVDLTNLLFAAAGAIAGLHLARILALPGRPEHGQAAKPRATPHALLPKSLRPAGVLACVMLAAVVAAGVLRFPVAAGWLGAGLVAYGFALLRWPQAWMLVIPFALPVLDLAPWSGWYFLDEFDLLVLTTVAVRLASGSVGRIAWPRGAHGWLAAAFALSVVLSLVNGLLPLPALDDNAFAHYYSRFNALRIGKGFAWAMLLLTLAPRDSEAGGRLFAIGVVCGLTGAVALACWERFVFAGFTDLDRPFRVGEFWSSMHAGGSHIEAFLVFALPFLAIVAWRSRYLASRVALVTLLLPATIYALMITYARGGYIAAIVVAFTLALALASAVPAQQRTRLLFAGGAAAALAVAAALPVLFGGFAQQRLASTGDDALIRTAHWDEARAIMTPGFSTEAFGMGLGRFPETYFYRSSDTRPPALFRYEREGTNIFLRLGDGWPLYVDQLIDVLPYRNYQLALDARSATDTGVLNVLVCERTFFFGRGCTSATLRPPAGKGWTHYEVALPTRDLGSGPWITRRPVKISLENAHGGGVVDVDNVSLRNEAGEELVANGSFSKGHARWFFSSSSNHLPWHIKNLYVALLFEQGWVGLLTFAAMVLAALAALARQSGGGSLFAAAALASATGILTIGVVDSLFDAPRLTTVFLLALLMPLLYATSGRKAVSRRREAPRATAAFSALSDAQPADIDAGRISGHATLFDMRSSVKRYLGLVILAALALALLTRLPQVHYDFRALPNPYHPAAAPVLLALFFIWVFATPVWIARWFTASGSWWPLLPAVIATQAVIGWAIVRQAALPAMLHKVTGAPVLGWPWDIETLLRFTALEGAFCLLLCGAAILSGPQPPGQVRRGWLRWAAVAALLLPLAHWSVVTQAATDNLIELMADHGAGSGLLAALWLTLIGVAGSTLATLGMPSHRSSRGVWWWLAATLASIPVGFALASVASAQAVAHGGKFFTALQFLLSADRSNYVTGGELYLRYAVAHLGLITVIGLAQSPAWKRAAPFAKAYAARA